MERPNELEPVEAERLRELESIIERGIRTAFQVGDALREIRDTRLYRQTHGTFEPSLKDRWDISRSYAHRTIDAAEVVAMLPMGNRPASERVARELVPLKDEPDAMADVWQQTVFHHEKPTAEDVRGAVKQYQRATTQQGVRPEDDPRYHEVDLRPYDELFEGMADPKVRYRLGEMLNGEKGR